MDKLFEPTVRDCAIVTACSNLVQAGVLLPEEVAEYMQGLTKYSDVQLGGALVTSRVLLDNHLKNRWSVN